MKFLDSLQFKFILAVFVTVAVVTVVLSVLSYVYEKRMLEDRVAAQLNSLADLKKGFPADYTNQRKNDLRLMGTWYGLRKRIAERIDPSGFSTWGSRFCPNRSLPGNCSRKSATSWTG